MWSTCPVVFNDPVLIMGYIEVEDFVLALGMPLVLAFFVDGGLCFLLGFGIALGSRWLKRGKPPGALVHTLHGLQLLPLPGVLSPQAHMWGP